MAAQQQQQQQQQQHAAGTVSEPKLTPLTHRPVVADEAGYHYRWDIQVGDTPSDLDWGDDIIKTDKKLSFEKDVRVQEFDKHQASDVVVHMKRRPDTKEVAVLPDRPDPETLKRKKRKKKKKKKRRRSKKKHRVKLGKPIRHRDEDDDADEGGGEEKKHHKKKRRHRKKKHPKKKHRKRKHKKKHKKHRKKQKKKKHKKKKRKKGKKKKKSKESKEKKASPPASLAPAVSPPSRAPSAPADQAPAVPVKPPGEEIAPLPPMGFPDGMIMVTTERSSSSLGGEPVTETIRMVGSPETFNRLSSQEPPNLQQLIAVSGGQPLGPFGQTTSQDELPAQQFNVQAIPPVPTEAGVVMEPGLTEQVVQAPGGPQIKIRTKTEIEMIQPEEEPPPPPRHGIEAITRQQIEEFPSPDGGEPRYSTSQENIIRRIELPGVCLGRRRSRRFYGANTRGIDISPDARIIRTTSRKVTGADGAPRIDTKVAISPPREGYQATAGMPVPLQAPGAALPAATSSSGSDVQEEAAILNQLSMMVNSRTNHELKRLRSAERRRARRARRQRRRRRRAARQGRRALKGWESTGDIPIERLQEQQALTSGMLNMAHSQLFNPTSYMQLPTSRYPSIAPAASVANALQQCCQMLENVADEFRMMPQPAISPSLNGLPQASRRRSRRNKSKQRQGSCISTVCSWLGLNEGDAEPMRKPSARRRQRRRRRRRRQRSSTTRGRSSSSRCPSSSGSTSGSSSWTSSVLGTSWDRSASTKHQSSRSSLSGTGRGSKEFEFITHITTVDPRKLRSGKVYRLKGADDPFSSDTVTTRNSVTLYRVATQQDRVGDWDDAERHEGVPRLHERLVERGDEGDYDGDGSGKGCRRKRSRPKRRHRQDRSWHSDGTYRRYYPTYCARSSQSYDRVPYRFSRYTAGYNDYSQHPLSERVHSQARIALGDARLYIQVAAPAVVPEVQPLLAEDLMMVAQQVSAPSIVPTCVRPIISTSTEVMTPTRRVMSATQVVNATPQYQMGLIPPPSTVHSQQSLVSLATNQTYVPCSAAYQNCQADTYLTPPTLTSPSVALLPQVTSVRQTQVVIQQGPEEDMQADMPLYEQDVFIEEPPLMAYETPPTCASQEWACEIDGAFGAIRTTIEEYSSPVQNCTQQPVFIEQPQPQFVAAVSTYQSTEPVLASPLQYVVYNNPYNYYGTMGNAAHQPMSVMMPNTSPLLNPLSTYTASAPVLRHMSRTYTEEEYLTDSSTTDSYGDFDALYARGGFATGATAGFTAPVSYLTSTTGTLGTSTYDSGRHVPIIPTRKPAYLDRRPLTPRDPQVSFWY
ncbi:uncharacterized protein LOC142770398 isoform X2 [Rhipicephalus microplus]|uniref:uncharacterized protein LOC142770398 isoform X2 n=1 Tax=Rhipicephalus microplus TaxID=6941 RepID=UPI003F6D15DD